MVSTMDDKWTLTAEQMQQWDRDGFLIVKGLFEAPQLAELQAYFDGVAEKGETIEGYWTPSARSKREDSSSILLPGEAADSILKRYPRFLQPHRIHELSRQMLLDARVFRVLDQLLGEPAVACQSMFYFKPPGAKGQALHQDNFYLEVEPQTCIAAWTAVDAADAENGGLFVVPGTHRLDTQCPERAESPDSFTSHLVNTPKGFKAVPAEMASGDVLFFNGQVIHGSGMNRSQTRWRRSFICHYMPATSRCVSRYYFPVLDREGNEVTYEQSAAGGPCGMEWKPSSYRE